MRHALDRFANCIWFTALATFALGPPIFVALGTMEIVQWAQPDPSHGFSS
jgi:hypothetical protein